MPSIYHTPDGAILKTPDGKLIKEPYNFGNAFQNKLGLNNYIKVDNLNINGDDLSLLTYISVDTDLGLSGAIGCAVTLVSTTSSIHQMIMNRGSGALNMTVLSNNTYRQFSAVHDFFCIAQNSVTNIYVGPFESLNNQTPLSVIYDKLYINNLFKHTDANGITPVGQGNINGINSRVLIFSRKITKGEYIYYRNNKLGNDLQSKFGVEVDLKCDFAEILDFSPLQDGSDMRVGCRDYSGYNRHGEIMNLPAGTAQQKVDFANANLFVPFQ